MDLRKDFNAVKADLFAWSGGLSQYEAKTPSFTWGADWTPGARTARRGARQAPPQDRIPAGPQDGIANSPSRRPTAGHQGGRTEAPAPDWLGAHARGTAVRGRHPAGVSRSADDRRPLVCFVHGGHLGEPAPALRSGRRHRHRQVKTLATLWDGGETDDDRQPRLWNRPWRTCVPHRRPLPVPS